MICPESGCSIADGDVPGTPGMNGVNEHFRPPLTPWGQAKFDSAQALSGGQGRCRQGRQFRLALRAERATASSHPSRIRGKSSRFRAGCSCSSRSNTFGAPSGPMGGRFRKIPTLAGSDTRSAIGKATRSWSKRSASTTRSGSISTGIRGPQRRTLPSATGD